MKNLLLACIILSSLGLIDAGYLAVAHYQQLIIPCSLTEGCDVVTRSSYATIGPIPVALLGVGYYTTVLALSILSLRNSRYARWLLALVSFGLIASLWFVYVQINILDAICQYCMVSALLTTLLFIGSLGVVRYRYE